MIEPKFTDCCGHGIECFVGHAYVPINDHIVDVYIFPNGNNPDFGVCLRYGGEDEEYYSIRSAKAFVEQNNTDFYGHGAIGLVKQKLEKNEHKQRA